MIQLALGIAAGVIDIASGARYLYEIVRGTTRPNTVSYSLWTLIGGIELSAQLAAGASWSVILVATLFVNMALITVLSLFGYGYKKHGFVDYVSFILALGAIYAWHATGDPIQALWWALGANVVSAVPTFVKAYRAPKTEDEPAWDLYALSTVLAVMSTEIYDLANLLIPGYLVFESFFTIFLLHQGRKRRARA